MKEVLISFIIALFIGAALNGLPKEQPRLPATTSQETDGQAAVTAKSDATEGDSDVTDPQAEAAVTETTQERFSADVLDSRQPVLVDFYADWCGPCKQMSPVVAKIAKQYEGKAKVFKVNIDKNPELVAKYGIDGIPTFIIFKKGAIAQNFAGSMPRADLAAALERQIN